MKILRHSLASVTRYKKRVAALSVLLVTTSITPYSFANTLTNNELHLSHQKKILKPHLSPQQEQHMATISKERAEEREKSIIADKKMASIYTAWPLLPTTTKRNQLTRTTDPSKSDNLFGDWWGMRSYLEKNGIGLSVNYLGEMAANVSGGMRKGADYAGQVSAAIDLNWETLIGWKGFSSHVLFMNRSGRPAGRDYVGDSIFNENEIYGAGGNVVAHLAYAYVQQMLWKNRIGIIAGRTGAAVYFNSSPIYCHFLSFGMCPTPRTITGGSSNAFVMPPQHNWAAFTGLTLPYNTYIRTGISAVGGQLGGHSGFNWSNHGVNGVMIPAEIGWTPSYGKNKNPIHLKAGFYGSTASAPDVAVNTTGQILAIRGGDAQQHRGYFAEWAGGDVMLLRHGSDPDEGLILFADYTHTNNKISIYQDMGLIGFEDRGFWKKRPLDSAGLMFIYSKQSQWLQNRLSDDPRTAKMAQSHTSIIELQYGLHAMRGIVIVPDFQYVFRPGGAGRYNDAAVLGLRLQAAL
ncbi:carbohydrate porin [Swingsia samuiensis]|uniref:Carbohydrate porin n=1 Tax=Swingsia samuiensis TaxID=1293412 RepID=A0A4Y6UKR6_9PROT|nr:carbohydrate porin [Swingsia samuiensis]QDH16991.1 carbohydrate porin [Swingsia samuiensis]